MPRVHQEEAYHLRDPERHWIHLTHHVFCNKELLRAIKATSKPLVMSTNGGDFECYSKGIFPGVGPVWYNPSGIVNVLSASLLRRSGKFETTYHENSRGS
jgi:hypothetical protein